MKDYRVVWPFLVSPVLAIGLILSLDRLGPVSCLTLGGTVLLLAGLFAFVSSPSTGMGLRRAVGAGIWTGVVVTAIPGLVAGLGSAALGVAALVALSSPAAVGLLARAIRPSTTSPGATPPGATAPDPGFEELDRLWRVSLAALQQAPDPETALILVEIRATLLDELERVVVAAPGPGWGAALARITPAQLRAVGRPHPSPDRRQPG